MAQTGSGDAAAVHELWTSKEYEVFVRYLEANGRSGAMHLSIKRYDREPVRDWRHLQAIKNEVCGWEREGMELFPRESRLVDQANQYHLFVMGAGVDLQIGWPDRLVLTQEEANARLNDPTSTGRQRPWQRGISTGPNYKP